MGGENSCRVEGSGAAPVVGVSLDDQFPPDPPLCVRLLSVKRRRDEWKKRAEADDESERISVDGPLSIVGGESEGVTFGEAVGRAGLISETETVLNTTGLPIC